MEKMIKFINNEESFIEFLKTQKMINNNTYSVNTNELKKFFEFETKDEIIEVSLSDSNDFYICSFLDTKFYFFKTMKTVHFQDSSGSIKNIYLQLPSEEAQYFENIFENKNNYDLYIPNIDNKWEKKDLDTFNIIDIKTNSYKIIEKTRLKLDNIQFSPFYEYYIFMTNCEAYLNFSYKETSLRNKFFKDLYLFFFFEPQSFLGICGSSGSGKTTSILYFIYKYRQEFNMIYINCYTILRKDLGNEVIKEILNYEIENSLNKIRQSEILDKFKKLIENLLQNDSDRENNFIFKLINGLIEIYNAKPSNKKLNIIIDQYSSKYDKDNKEIFLLIEKINIKKSRCRILLISSMNNTCVKNNMKYSLKNDKNVPKKYIQYSLYGELFEINDIIDKENNNELKDVMNEEFGNSALIYYRLKSRILELDNYNEENIINNIITEFVKEEEKNIINEIENFYNIMYSNDSLSFIKNYLLSVLEALNYINNNNQVFNFINIPDLFEKLPFKFFKITYNEIEISHPEFIRLLPKNIREIIDKLINVTHSLDENYNCPLKKKLNNNLEELNNYLCKFNNEKKYITFFNIEPLYPIIEKCLKEIIFYDDFRQNILNDIYSGLKGGIKGDLFEYILTNFIMFNKKFINDKFEIIENINSLVPYSFSITKFSHRLYILKNNNNNETETEENEEEESIDEEEEDDDKDSRKEQKINKGEKLKKIKYDKKRYSKSKDKSIFKQLKEIIDKTFNQKYLKKEINLPKKNIYLNQLHSNAKYVDGGLLIYIDEGQKLNFKLIIFQITIKRKRNKIFNKNEYSLILTYIKDHLEKRYPNINIIESVFYYIIDLNEIDNTIINECKKNSIGVYGFKIQPKMFSFINKDKLIVSKFSKFNSCFIFKSNTNINNNIITLIDSKEPILFKKINSDKIKKYYKPLFYKDLNISKDFYLYKDIKFSFDLYKHLTNYAFFIYVNDSSQDIQYIILSENKVLDYCLNEVKDINDVDTFELIKCDLRLITFLIPMKLKKKYK